MWYVIQVKTGEESGIARKLKNQAIRAEVPIENRPIRSGGAWTKKEYILFPGYVFLDMDFTARNYYRVKEVPGVIRFLGDSKAPSTLSYLEAEWIRILSGSGEPLEPTLVREDRSGGITVISGVLWWMLPTMRRVKAIILISLKLLKLTQPFVRCFHLVIGRSPSGMRTSM